jgi:hypothetical protein
MKIQVNKNAINDSILESFNKCVKQITFNAENGIDTTDLYVPIHIANEVREKLEKEIENICFLVVRRGFHSYTGNPLSFTGETIGDERHYKVMLK